VSSTVVEDSDRRRRPFSLDADSERLDMIELRSAAV
jgi:hypothetical protein